MGLVHISTAKQYQLLTCDVTRRMDPPRVPGLTSASSVTTLGFFFDLSCMKAECYCRTTLNNHIGTVIVMPVSHLLAYSAIELLWYLATTSRTHEFICTSGASGVFLSSFGSSPSCKVASEGTA